MSERINAIKDLQAWVKKAPMCDNCKSLTFEYEIWGTPKGRKKVKAKFRCVIGDFATKPDSICKKWGEK